MKQYFCVGTYTEPILFGTGDIFQGKGEGVYLCALEDGNLSVISSIPMRNPSFVCVDEQRKKIYAVNELKEYLGAFGGGVTEASYNSAGEMQVDSTYGTAGTDPCHIILSPDRTSLFIANFSSGALTAFPLDSEGHILPDRQLFQHKGSSVHPKRQRGPHAHSTIFADEHHLFVPDLGLDRLVAYNYVHGRIQSAPERTAAVAPGSGPRFGEYSPDGGHFYLINELGCSITHFTWDGTALTTRATVSTLPADHAGESICADLHITPDGKFLYASNRGHDSITAFAVEEDGSLRRIGCQSCGGKTPRNFAIDNTGHYLLVGNQDSDTIAIFEIQSEGTLNPISVTSFPSPVCIRFLQSTL